MKLKEAIPMYRAYRQTLVEQTRDLTKQRDAAAKKYETTGDQAWEQEAASLNLSLQTSQEAFEKNQDILDNLLEQYNFAWNNEVNKAMSDPETGMAATMGKIMTTVARMCAGDKVPYSDEKKVMDYDNDLYMKVKMAQTTMAAIKKKRKEYDSLWDDDEGQEYDPEAAADNAQAAIPADGAENISVDAGTVDSVEAE